MHPIKWSVTARTSIIMTLMMVRLAAEYASIKIRKFTCTGESSSKHKILHGFQLSYIPKKWPNMFVSLHAAHAHCTIKLGKYTSLMT